MEGQSLSKEGTVLSSGRAGLPNHGGVPTITPEVVVPGHPVQNCQCASDLAGTGISKTLVPRMVDPRGSPKFGPGQVPQGELTVHPDHSFQRADGTEVGFLFPAFF